MGFDLLCAFDGSVSVSDAGRYLQRTSVCLLPVLKERGQAFRNILTIRRDWWYVYNDKFKTILRNIEVQKHAGDETD